MLGIQVTLVTIALSTTTLVYQSVATQYTPRLLVLASPTAPLYREISLFVLNSSYTLAGIHRLGLSAAGMEPRPVVLGGLLLVIVALTSVLVTIAKTFRHLQVEEILRGARDETLISARRLARARSSLPSPVRPPPSSASERMTILAPKSGYVVGFDLARLKRYAHRFGLRVRIDQTFGGFVACGDRVGWFAAATDARREHVAEALGASVLIAGRRNSFLDVGFGLRVLADIADRALSAAINDPTTARQTLHQIRTVLLELVRMPPGDVLLFDHGPAQVSIALPRFQDYLATALDGPIHYGSGDANVVAEILDLARELGEATDCLDRRAAARSVAERALAAATHRREIEPARLASLKEAARAVALALKEEPPAAECCPSSDPPVC